MTDPILLRIATAARAKGFEISEMQNDIKVVLEATESVLRGDNVHEVIAKLAYHCLACRSEVHDLCMNFRGPGLPIAICICAHPFVLTKEDPN